jgi:heptosyltransferase I
MFEPIHGSAPKHRGQDTVNPMAAILSAAMMADWLGARFQDPRLTAMSQDMESAIAAVLSEADVLLTNDSGPMHLAAGLGTPVVGLFTCTSPERSGPPGERHELVSTTLSCAASYRKRCPHRGRRHMACLDELATDRVWRALVRVMEKNRGVRRAA